MANNAYAKHKSRLFWILSAFMVCMVLLVVQLFRWQIVESQELQRRALGQWTSSTVVSASRGSIYDRNMELLAVSASSKSLVVQPAQIAKKGDPNKTADQLAAAARQLQPSAFSNFRGMVRNVNSRPMSCASPLRFSVFTSPAPNRVR